VKYAMAQKKLHPSVEQFKQFVRENPKILQEVRSGRRTLQELYEDWYLLGEEDSKWAPYRETEGNQSTAEATKQDWMTNLLGTVKKMDVNQLQGVMQNLSTALGAVQGVVSQFQSGTGGTGSTSQSSQKPSNPFSFRKD
jgi:hypothetical protein